MNQIIVALFLVILTSCSSFRAPSSQQNHDESYSEAAGGNIKVVAKRYYQNKNFCAEFTLQFKSLKEKETLWSNWSVSYVDSQGLTQVVQEKERVPASTTGGNVINSQYYHEEFTTKATTCFPAEKVSKVYLTPKSLSYKIQPMEFSWH
jgi:hypothetical protein